MIPSRRASWALLAVGIAAGTAADVPLSPPPLVRGEYLVLEADFHVHSFFGDGALAPWDLVLEARRRGLHAFAITNHNQVLAAKIGRWFAAWAGGPVVLVGEEITAPRAHIIAVGITSTVDWRQPAAETIDAVHAQGGVAIAAHPAAAFWPAFDERALGRLDGAEVAHPTAYVPRRARQLREFLRRAESVRGRVAPIGSSDYHALVGRLGLCRTYLLAREQSEAGVLDALRAGRTVAYAPDGEVYGDASLVALIGPPATQAGEDTGRHRAASYAGALGSVCGWLGLLGLVLLAPAATSPFPPTPPRG